ncbi:hypothetical protein J2T11_003219 [Paenarthrobacter nicotinovorans]|uniref:hypothetical protein n=1 Tax=Paenarthrobacter nicotinovorans TaxID=29320 RepID=UPI002781B3D6|nr:hypothetical protein [Paenarthrobacter nicotinovorans]MDP9936851.1 hypothetical protein [Paenarthrobacter nicotinovorans]
MKGQRRPKPEGRTPVADEIRTTEADTVAPDASPAEDILELRLLTAGPITGPVDRPLADHRLDEP